MEKTRKSKTIIIIMITILIGAILTPSLVVIIQRHSSKVFVCSRYYGGRSVYHRSTSCKHLKPIEEAGVVCVKKSAAERKGFKPCAYCYGKSKVVDL